MTTVGGCWQIHKIRQTMFGGRQSRLILATGFPHLGWSVDQSLLTFRQIIQMCWTAGSKHNTTTVGFSCLHTHRWNTCVNMHHQKT